MTAEICAHQLTVLKPANSPHINVSARRLDCRPVSLVLIVLDAGGLELHRQPVRTSPLSHSDGQMAWSARVPYFEGAANVVLREPQTGDIRAMGEILTSR